MKVREVQVPRGAAGAAIGLIVGGGIDNNAATVDYPPPPPPLQPTLNTLATGNRPLLSTQS